MSYLVCGIYEKRPEVCKTYPRPDSYHPDACGYYFTGEERKGRCYLDCQASCCSLPREGGEPGGAPLPEVAGGEPCRHLESVDRPPKGVPVERGADESP